MKRPCLRSPVLVVLVGPFLLLTVARSEPPAPLGFPVEAAAVQQSQRDWAEELQRPVEFVNSVGMRLRLVPPGSFQMGSLPDEPGRGNDEWRYQVALRRPFYLGICEVTQQQYRQVMGEEPSLFARGAAFEDRVEGIETGQFPVDSVSWYQAVAFCRRLSSSEQESHPQRRYRLPTEAEWEFACRAGSSGFFPGGRTVAQLGEVANYRHRQSASRPLPVGQLVPNPLGLHDMQGNVWEWCRDWYRDRPPQRTRLVDPAGPIRGSTRVIRGGGWYSGPARVRHAERAADPPSVGDPDTGFRVVLEISGTRYRRLGQSRSSVFP